MTKGVGVAGPSDLAMLTPSAEAESGSEKEGSLMEKIALLVLPLW
jgi:hypothetical protein